MKRSAGFVLLVGVSLAAFGHVVLQRALRESSRLTPPRHRDQSANPARAVPSQANTGTSGAQLVQSYGKLPLSFEMNRGQTGAQVKFLSRGKGYALFLTGEEAVLSLRGNKRQAGADLISKRATYPRFGFEAPRRPRNSRSPFEHVQLPESKSPSVIRMKLAGANPNAEVVGLEELPGKANYFIGNDPKKWRTNVATYAKVKYREVYPGIDLVYYGNQGKLEYDFVVAPNVDPGAIKLAVAAEGGPFALEGKGAVHGGSLEIDASGDLVVQTNDDAVRFHKPFIYQPAAHTEEVSAVDGHWVFAKKNARGNTSEFRVGSSVDNTRTEVAFEVGDYDHTRPLIIDPVLVYSTYLGGTGGDTGNAITADSAGNVYVTGNTASADFPTASPAQGASGGGTDVFVAKVNAAGSALVYSTYLGGSGGDSSNAIAVDSSGNAYITGTTQSTNFPTKNPIQATNGSVNGNAFVAKLNAAGSALVYSTYLGGTGGSNDVGFGIALDSSGNAYVTGVAGTTDFPTMNPIQGASAGPVDAFVAKLNAAGSALVYSTYLGGSGDDDQGNAIAVDSSGNAYVAGTTDSTDFPIANSSPFNPGGCIGGAFVTKINAGGTALTYSTYLGCGGNNGVAVDPSGNAYVTGNTFSSSFPTKNPIQAALAGSSDAFVAKLNSAGNALVYSTYLGGSGYDVAAGIAVDSSGDAYITGITGSTDFPIRNPIQSSCCPSGGDLFVAKLNAAGSALAYSTYLGGSNSQGGAGIGVDASGNTYVTGGTGSTDFPTLNPLQPTCGGDCFSSSGTATDAFVAKISPANASAVSFAPAAVDFSGFIINGTSPARTVNLLNVGSVGANISNISIAGTNSGDFALGANTCGSTLAGGANCTMNVTFTPTASGSRTATITATDDASNSPQSMVLTGAGEDFGIGAAPGSPSSATVTAGETATYTLSVSPLGGFSHNVSLSCSGAPAGGTCTPSSASVTLDGTNPQNVTVTVTTAKNALLSADSRPRGWQGNRITFFVVGCLAVFLAALLWPTGHHLRPQAALATVALCLISTASLAACGGGGGSTGPPPQTFTLTVTGTTPATAVSPSLSHQTNLTLIVN